MSKSQRRRRDERRTAQLLRHVDRLRRHVDRWREQNDVPPLSEVYRFPARTRAYLAWQAGKDLEEASVVAKGFAEWTRNTLASLERLMRETSKGRPGGAGRTKRLRKKRDSAAEFSP